MVSTISCLERNYSYNVRLLIVSAFAKSSMRNDMPCSSIIMAAAAKIFSLTVTNIALLSYSLLYLLKLKVYYSVPLLSLLKIRTNVKL